MSIKHWPEAERPREKLLAQGAQHLSDAELLAIFLRTGVRGRTAVDLARDLLNQFGSLRNLLTANQKDFCAHMGLGTAKFALLQAVLEMGKRHHWQQLERGVALTDASSAQTFIASKLRDHPHEVFACLFLDNRHRVICFEEIFRGTINAASVYPRVILQQCLKHNAAAIILAHNHPSGVSEPSNSDRDITQKLTKTLDLVDIRVLDHIIVGDCECYSFAEQGIL
jgi:DNA repair protein RadC